MGHRIVVQDGKISYTSSNPGVVAMDFNIDGNLSVANTLTATTVTGALTGNATTASSLQTARTISITGDATWSTSFNGSANVSNAITLATVNSSPQSNQFRKITVNGKGLITATTTVDPGDITGALGYTPINKAGDTMSGFLILNADPVNNLGAVTKQYADSIAAGINVHESCVTSTTSALPSATYNNGASGVGATLTATANGAIGTVGGYSSISVNNRILVKDQAAQAQNGIYVVTQVGDGSNPWILTRAADFDGAPSSEIAAGTLTYVSGGTLTGTQWVQVTTGTIVVGTSPIVFSQFAGSGTYSSGTGISIVGTTISNTGVTSVAGTLNQINASAATGNITLSLPSSVTIGGTLTAGTFSGSGSGLSGIPNSALTNNSLTIGSTNIALGATSTTLAGLTSVAATTFTGALSGNSTTATTLQTARLINGTSFNGSSDITITAANPNAITFNNAGSGAASGSTYTGSSPLTVSFNTVGAPSTTGTNASGTWGINVTGSAGSVAASNVTGTTLASNVVSASITALTSAGLTLNGTAAAVNTGFELGYTGGSATTSFIDFHSGATATDYDVRLASTGGNGSAGNGSLGVTAASTSFTGSVSATTFSGAGTGLTGTGNSFTSGATNALTSTALATSNVWSGATQQFNTASSVGTGGAAGGLQAFSISGSTSAAMSFHRSGVYAINMGLDTDNVFRLGGWSDGGSTYRLQSDTAGNLTVRGNLTTGTTLVIGTTIPTVNGFSPANGVLRMTPNLHLNASSGSAVILNWDNGNTGTTQTVRIGNGAAGDAWYCGQNGATVQTGSITAPVATITPNTTGVSTGLTCANGDLTVYRSGGTTGVLFMSNNGTRYLYYDGANYNLSGVGLIVSGDVTAFSDIRVKKNIEIIADPLDKLLKIRGVTFNRTDTGYDPERRYTGVIAQEVEQVLPEAVSESEAGPDGTGGGIKNVAYGNMVGLLIEAIKELNAKVESLKAEIAMLKG